MKPGERASTSAAENFARLNPLAAREYLLTIAGTLQAIFSPGFKGDAQARASECIHMLPRIAQQLAPLQGKVALALDELRRTAPGEFAQTEGRALDALEANAAELLAQVQRIASAPSRQFDAGRLEAFVRSHPRSAPTTRLVSAKALQGGRSKQTVLVTLADQGPQLPAEMVLRQDWSRGVPRTTVVSEYEVLKALSSFDLKMPKPVLLETADDALGAPFMMMTRLQGKIEGNLFSPPKSERMALELGEQLGRLHSLRTDQFIQVPWITTRAFTHDQLRSELDEYRTQCAMLDTPSETINAIFRWLESTIGRVEGPLSMVHGDLGFHNFLVHDGGLAGILDWELAHLGSAAEDLGYCKGDVEQMTDWPRFLRAYRDAGGPALSEFLISFYSLWSGIHLYCMLLMARAGVTSGQVYDVEVAYCCVNATPVLVHRMSRQLRTILDQGSP
jgi:aminoglycoside phosphotransferase (APT) family kinase protein